VSAWLPALVPVAVLGIVLLLASAGCTLDTQGAGPSDQLPTEEPPPALDPYETVVKTTPDLVAYWRLGEAAGATAADEVGKSNQNPDGIHPGQYTDSPKLGEPGLVAGATSVLFDGGYVEVPGVQALNPAPSFTIEAIVKPQVALGPGELGVIVSSSIPAPQQLGFSIFRISDGADQIERWAAGVGGGASAGVATGRPVIAGESALIVAAYDGATQTLELWDEASTDPSATVVHAYVQNDPSDPLTIGIGKNNGQVANPFKGWIEEVALFGRKLDKGEIQNHLIAQFMQ
jgi:hypothetical protein